MATELPDDDTLLEEFGDIFQVFSKPPAERVGVLILHCSARQHSTAVIPNASPKTALKMLSAYFERYPDTTIVDWYEGRIVAPPREHVLSAIQEEASRRLWQAKSALACALENNEHPDKKLCEGDSHQIGYCVECDSDFPPEHKGACTHCGGEVQREDDPDHYFCEQCNGRRVYYGGSLSLWDIWLKTKHLLDFEKQPEYDLPKGDPTHICISNSGPHQEGTRLIPVSPKSICPTKPIFYFEGARMTVPERLLSLQSARLAENERKSAEVKRRWEAERAEFERAQKEKDLKILEALG